jgi:site-specific recombinase XerC
MKNENGFPSLLERFFTQRLIAQRRVSSHTVASYRDTFRLLLSVAAKKGASLAVEREPGVGLRSGLRWAQK